MIFIAGCDIFELSGTQFHQETEGIYRLLNRKSGCGKKPMFWKSEGGFYLFYNTQDEMWAVSKAACGGEEVLHAFDNVYSPDSIQAWWREREHESATDWEVNQNIKVSCQVQSEYPTVHTMYCV